jgi:transcription initiation factor TFIID TATA-box-binding protein
MEPEIKIENVVASATIAEKLDLLKLNVLLPDSDYKPERFPGLIVHMQIPKIAALLFSSGKIVLTGAKSVDETYQAVEKICSDLKKFRIKLDKSPKITIQNIVASANLGVQLNLLSVAQAIGLEKIEYEPEQFPGLVYRLEEHGVVVLLFGSGKLVCTGAKKISNITDAVATIVEELTAKRLV